MIPRSGHGEGMNPFTAKLWAKQDQHEGDRQRLFSAVGDALEATSVLYPGSYVDIAPSFVFPAVTYVDVDDRARRFFADTSGVLELVQAHRSDDVVPDVQFVHGDYSQALDLGVQSFDLLVSLYAGFVSEHCTDYLRIGGTLLVNPSHGDAAMASIDERYELDAVVKSGSGGYSVDHSDLGRYLIPKTPQEITIERLHELGRGIGYTKSPFAYLFTRVS